MPTGSRERMTMADMTQWTAAELDREFAGESRDGGVGGERGRRKTVSSDRLSSSSGSLTPSTSLPSLSDGPPSQDRERKEGTETEDGEGRKRRNSARALWQTVKKAGTELNQDTRKVFRYIGRKLHSRHEPRKTKVKEVHILPGEEEDGMWARRLAGSAHSGSSSSSDPPT